MFIYLDFYWSNDFTICYAKRRNGLQTDRRMKVGLKFVFQVLSVIFAILLSDDKTV